mmetsp:Transcript_21520/g.31615  ORF Transcript_21520/g.31615 Transcript_21520/m.31615 type:complete len:146 (+) Transcript_21520:95-532(+)
MDELDKVLREHEKQFDREAFDKANRARESATNAILESASKQAADDIKQKENSPKLSDEPHVKISDKAFILVKVKENGMNLKYASEELRNDKEVVLAAMTENHEALEFASDDLKRDSDVIGLFVEKNDDKDENDMLLSFLNNEEMS